MATTEGPTIEGLAAAEEPTAVEEPAAGGVGPWRTCGLKEWAPLVFAIFGHEEKQLERRWVFRNGWMKRNEIEREEGFIKGRGVGGKI